VAATLRNGGPGPDRRLLTTEQEEQVQRAIEALPDQLREVVLLRDYEGLEHEQIADLVGATSAAVRKRYSRALARLGELLQDEER
jgi:RNA polymerase sigma-70 factor (ECF subfamily)